MINVGEEIGIGKKILLFDNQVLYHVSGLLLYF